MKYNQLGKTGYEISAISFGASSLGGVFHEIDEHKAIEAVHVALELGINYFDGDQTRIEYPSTYLLPIKVLSNK